jgi:hypothetical protein
MPGAGHVSPDEGIPSPPLFFFIFYFYFLFLENPGRGRVAAWVEGVRTYFFELTNAFR